MFQDQVFRSQCALGPGGVCAPGGLVRPGVPPGAGGDANSCHRDPHHPRADNS